MMGQTYAGLAANVLLVVLVLYVVLLVIVYVSQENLIFLGAKPDTFQYKQVEAKSLTIEVEHVNLHGWRTNGAAPDSKRVLIYYGGNAEDVVSALALLEQLEVAKIYTFNYRSYGLSEGEPSEERLYKDALTIYDFVSTSHSDKDVIVIGRSMGTAIAGYVAAHRSVDKLMLFSPLHSVSKMARHHYKGLVPDFLVKHKFNLYAYAPKIKANTLVFIGDKDSVIPVSHSKQTYEVITAPKSLQTIHGAGHNDLFGNIETAELNAFIESARQ